MISVFERRNIDTTEMKEWLKDKSELVKKQMNKDNKSQTIWSSLYHVYYNNHSVTMGNLIQANEQDILIVPSKETHEPISLSKIDSQDTSSKVVFPQTIRKIVLKEKQLVLYMVEPSVFSSFAHRCSFPMEPMNEVIMVHKSGYSRKAFSDLIETKIKDGCHLVFNSHTYDAVGVIGPAGFVPIHDILSLLDMNGNEKK
jgi:hypothetical protein